MASAKRQKNKAEEDLEVVQVALRIPADILENINNQVAARRIKTPRHTWMLEALVEKLERERDG